MIITCINCGQKWNDETIIACPCGKKRMNRAQRLAYARRLGLSGQQAKKYSKLMDKAAAEKIKEPTF